MTGKGHIIASGITGGLLTYEYQVEPYYLLWSIIGGLFPDTDHPHSLLGRFIPLWLIVKPHRKNITHSFAGSFVFSILIFGVGFLQAAFFLVGYLSHLLLDLCNKTGVPLWWPNKKMYAFARIKGGGIAELLVIFIFYMMILALIYFIKEV